MVGICSYGAYIPLYRLSRDEIGKAWGGGGRGERAVANYDEDSLTMGVEAARDSLTGLDPGSVQALFFATTTSPFREKQAAATIATAIDLPGNVFTSDCTGSLRSGTIALRLAADAVKAGSVKEALVTAADCRMAFPQSSLEQSVGDGAAAVVMGDENVIATIAGHYSRAVDFTDFWRREEDKFIHTWEERFILTEGYQTIVPQTVATALKKFGLEPKDFSKLVLYAPNARSHGDVARRLGFDPRTQLQDPLFDPVGNTGSASVLMQLAAALETAKPGDKILVVGYGDGCDVFAWQITDAIEKLKPRRGIKGYLRSKKMLPSYHAFLNLRQLIPLEPSRQPPISPAATILWREQNALLRFHGSKCKKCGEVQVPIHRICSNCSSKDNFEEVPVANKKARVYLATVDNLGYGAETSPFWAIVDLEGGGRTRMQIADADLDEVQAGDELEMTFRKFPRQGDVPTYFWKTRIIR